MFDTNDKLRIIRKGNYYLANSTTIEVSNFDSAKLEIFKGSQILVTTGNLNDAPFTSSLVT